MISKDKVVLYLDDALLVLGVILLNEEKQLGFDSGLVVVLLLVLDELHGN